MVLVRMIKQIKYNSLQFIAPFFNIFYKHTEIQIIDCLYNNYVPKTKRFLHHRCGRLITNTLLWNDTAFRPGPGPTHVFILWVPGALSPVVKRPWREADYSPPSSADVKNAWIGNSTPAIRLHGVVLRVLS